MQNKLSATTCDGLDAPYEFKQPLSTVRTLKPDESKRER